MTCIVSLFPIPVSIVTCRIPLVLLVLVLLVLVLLVLVLLVPVSPPAPPPTVWCFTAVMGK